MGDPKNWLEKAIKSDTYNSLPATAFKIFDPTGISSYGDVYNAWSDKKFDYNDILQPLGALPVVGKLGKVGKFLGEGIKGLNNLEDAKKVISAANKVVDITGGIKTARGLKGGVKTLAREKYFEPIMKGVERTAGIKKMEELKAAEELLRKSKLINTLQYGVRASGDVGNIVDVSSGAKQFVENLIPKQKQGGKIDWIKTYKDKSYKLIN